VINNNDGNFRVLNACGRNPNSAEATPRKAAAEAVRSVAQQQIILCAG
jgi:hypothetical protein